MNIVVLEKKVNLCFEIWSSIDLSLNRISDFI